MVIRIRDHGKGMQPHELAQLFSPLRVAGQVARTANSSGFGLFLSHLLVEGQGGSLTCASAPGQGTTMTLILPVAFQDPFSPGR